MTEFAHFSATEVKLGPELLESLRPCMKANLSRSMKDGESEDGSECDLSGQLVGQDRRLALPTGADDLWCVFVCLRVFVSRY